MCVCVCVDAVSRPTVCKSIDRVLETVVEKLGVQPFPLDDPEKLEAMAAGFRQKSCGKLFRNVVGAFDGYLLRISRKCLKHETNSKKYWCRKQFYAINCQVGCDAQRRVTYLSIMCPGATPDILAHIAGPLHAAILAGRVDKKWQFIGDAAFPTEYEQHPAAFLIPFTRSGLRDALTRVDRDSFNFYHSQLRIVIECVFGMLVNKFRVLSRALETTSLKRAVLTFRACCALHNFIINDRLTGNNNVSGIVNTPRGARLIQQAGTTEVEFVEVPTVLPHHESVVYSQGHSIGVAAGEYVETDRASAVAPTMEEMVARVAQSGYIRPRTYGVTQNPYIFY